MRKIQRGESVNLAFWLAYQAHQINRSKSRHLNLCHIVGVFIRNNMELIHARQGLNMERCMSPRPFNIDFLIEHQIVRVLEENNVFYEPGKVTPKTRNRSNVVQAQEDKNKAKTNDKYSLEWLVDEMLDQRTRNDKIHSMVVEIWEAMKKVVKTKAGDAIVEEGVEEEEKKEEDVDMEGDGGSDHEKTDDKLRRRKRMKRQSWSNWPSKPCC